MKTIVYLFFPPEPSTRDFIHLPSLWWRTQYARMVAFERQRRILFLLTLFALLAPIGFLLGAYIARRIYGV